MNLLRGNFLTVFLLFTAMCTGAYAATTNDNAMRPSFPTWGSMTTGTDTRQNTGQPQTIITGTNQNVFLTSMDLEPEELTDEEINRLFDVILGIPEVEEEEEKNNSSRKNRRGTMTQTEKEKEEKKKEKERKKKKREANAINELFKGIPRYGMSFFKKTPSNFAPMESAPVTQDYRINIGDEMTLSIWGIPEEGNINFIIDRNGQASIPRIGTLRLAGYTMAQAEHAIRSRLNQYYTGFQMNLSMGELSSILVYITGNAARPGAYTISSFSTLVNALIASGGPSENGTLRKIELKRNGKTIAIFDMYAMLMKGDKTQDMRLQAGDVIHIPSVGPLVGIAGEVSKPGIYELNGTTRVNDLLSVIGGINARTFRGRVQYFRIFKNSYASAFEGSFNEFENTELYDGDIIRLYPVYNFASSANITGAVRRPGTFAIVPGHTKISEIIQRAGGLTPTASDMAEITRVTPSLEGPVNERFNVNVTLALQGDPENNLTLEYNDQITVLVIPDWKEQIRVTIKGEVKRPGSYSMFPGEKLSDLITRAGGFTSRAFLRGAVFTRKSVAEEQRQALDRMADQMERDLLQSVQNSQATDANSAAVQQDYQRRMELIDSLRDLDIMGRVITKIDSPKDIIDTTWDYELQDGDALDIPQTPLTVNIMGAVYASSSHVYQPNMSISAYISSAGGALKNAHKRMVYLLKSDGTTIKLTRRTGMLASGWKAPRGYSPKVEPGDTIVVPVKYLDRTGIESVKDTVDIIYKVAVAVGVILDQSND